MSIPTASTAIATSLPSKSCGRQIAQQSRSQLDPIFHIKLPSSDKDLGDPQAMIGSHAVFTTDAQEYFRLSNI